MEPIVKVLFAVLGVSIELFVDHAVNLYVEDGELVAKHLLNYTHAVMYGLFGLSGVVDLVMWSADRLHPQRRFCHFRCIKMNRLFRYVLFLIQKQNKKANKILLPSMLS